MDTPKTLLEAARDAVKWPDCQQWFGIEFVHVSGAVISVSCRSGADAMAIARQIAIKAGMPLKEC